MVPIGEPMSHIFCVIYNFWTEWKWSRNRKENRISESHEFPLKYIAIRQQSRIAHDRCQCGINRSVVCVSAAVSIDLSSTCSEPRRAAQLTAQRSRRPASLALPSSHCAAHLDSSQPQQPASCLPRSPDHRRVAAVYLRKGAANRTVLLEHFSRTVIRR